MRLKGVLFFVILMTINSRAQDYFLNINLNDGRKITYNISDVLKIEFKSSGNMVSVEEANKILKSFKLFYNYPNPFNPSTTIKYEIPETGDVNVKIYNITGSLVKTLLNQNQHIGFHTITWDGTNNMGSKVSSGLYIYSVKFGETILSKKMILLK